jgi:CubicO group peptidase (beta-lactamase class C family)
MSSTAARAQDAAGGPTPEQQLQMQRLSQRYMEDNGIHGLSVAFARSGQIVFARGYGMADAGRGLPVTPQSLFRIASVSKAFTSAAVYTLVESGRLSLDATVFGSSGILNQFKLPPAHPDWTQQIQIRHLLTHTEGGWPNGQRDPMLLNPKLNHQELIAHTLETYPLANPPGAKFAYSNFGYCLLGRIIEKIAGTPYADYVREHIFSRVGITEMRIAGNTARERAPGEVAYYYGKAYEMNVARMDSHGGWIATPSDLLRFAIHDVGFPPQPQLLSADTVRDMTTGTTANPRYAKGWRVNAASTYFHLGRLPGSGALLVRNAKGTMWAALINGTINHDTTGRDITNYMWSMVKAVPQWPV